MSQFIFCRKGTCKRVSFFVIFEPSVEQCCLAINLFIMESKLRVEFDFETKEPVIEITLAKNTDDMRDQMLRAFVQSASWDDSRLFVVYPSNNTDNSRLQIRCTTNPTLTEEEYLEIHHVKINAKYLQDWGDHKPYEKDKDYNLMFCTTSENCILLKDSGHIVREGGFRKYSSLYQFLEYWSVNEPKVR